MAGKIQLDPVGPFCNFWSPDPRYSNLCLVSNISKVLFKMAAENVGAGSTSTEVKEGKAVVLFPDFESVFYNPVQEFNRDLSVLVIKEFIDLYDADRRYNPASKKGPKAKKQNYSPGGEERIEEEIKDPEPSDAPCEGLQPVDKEFTLKVDGEQNESTESGAITDRKTATIRILEGLAATGLRSIRYALEIEGIAKIIANDLSKAAVENIKRNIAYNKVEDIVEGSWSDAG